MATISVNSFTSGTTILSSEMNANFTTIVNAINGGIDTINLTDGAVSTNKLDALAVTDAKVATGINASKIGGGTVGNTAFGYLANVTSDIQAQLNAKAASAHTHDDRYYTETEADALLAAKLGTTAQAADSDQVDGLEGADLLRSNASDSYSSGTLTFSSGTTLDLGSATVILPVTV